MNCWLPLARPPCGPTAPLNQRTPCGACRQWLADLAPEATIYIDGATRDFSVPDLLPFAFEL